MTSYDSIDAYHAAFPPEVQLKLGQLREIIRANAPQAVETISYHIPIFKQEQNLVHYAAYRNHIGFYPTPGAISAFAKELAGFTTSKGAVQFPIDQPLPVELIAQIVLFRVASVGK